MLIVASNKKQNGQGCREGCEKFFPLQILPLTWSSLRVFKELYLIARNDAKIFHNRV